MSAWITEGPGHGERTATCASACWGAATSAPPSPGWCTSTATTSRCVPAAASRSRAWPCATGARPRRPVAPEVFTTDGASIVDDPDIDIVLRAARRRSSPRATLILRAFAAGKPVVTANKELLANDGEELFEAADAAGCDLCFEAAVAGGIPLIAPLKESLAGERIVADPRIVNGTTNYILTQMSEHGRVRRRLAEAQRLGYAEADPTADVEGFDAAAKCAILASIAFNTRVVATTCTARASRGSRRRTSPTPNGWATS